MAKDLAGTGVTVNVLVPGGVTNTGMVPLEAGYDRAEMIQPEVMSPPLNWLVSDAAGSVTGRRFLGVHGTRNFPRKKPLQEPAPRSPGPKSRQCQSNRRGEVSDPQKSTPDSDPLDHPADRAAEDVRQG